MILTILAAFPVLEMLLSTWYRGALLTFAGLILCKGADYAAGMTQESPSAKYLLIPLTILLVAGVECVTDFWQWIAQSNIAHQIVRIFRFVVLLLFFFSMSTSASAQVLREKEKTQPLKSISSIEVKEASTCSVVVSNYLKDHFGEDDVRFTKADCKKLLAQVKIYPKKSGPYKGEAIVPAGASFHFVLCNNGRIGWTWGTMSN
jgi:hypothetical protein